MKSYGGNRYKKDQSPKIIRTSRTVKMLRHSFVLLLSLRSIMTFRAYDCAVNHRAREPIDLKKVKECDSLESQYPTIQDSRVQVLKAKNFEEVTVYECRLFETVQANFCGQVDSISYGIPEDLKTMSPLLISPRECRNLVEDHKVSYHDTVFHVQGKTFGFDYMLTGTRDTDGSCTRGPDFTHRGKNYVGYAKRSIVQGSVYVRKLKFDPVSKRITIDGKILAMSLQQHETETATFVWNDEDVYCLDRLQEVYQGQARIYYPDKENDSPVATVKVEDKELFFGLKLKSKTLVCEHVSFETQIPGVFLVLNNTFVQNIEQLHYTDNNPYDNLVALLGYNYVTRSQEFSSAMQTISEKTCEIERKALMNQLSILRHHAGTGIFEVFGEPGFFSVTRGSAVYVIGCKSIDVQLRNIDEDTNDIPVFYEGNPMFVDPISYNLKQNSTVVEHNPHLPVMWEYSGHWICKNQRTIACNPPKVLESDMSSVKEALKKKVNTAYEGGLTSKEDREAYRRLIYHENHVSSTIFAMGEDVADKNNPMFVEKMEDHFGFLRMAKKAYGIINYSIDEHIFFYLKWFMVGLSALLTIDYFNGIRLRLKTCKREKLNWRYKIHAIFCPQTFINNLRIRDKKDIESALIETTKKHPDTTLFENGFIGLNTVVSSAPPAPISLYPTLQSEHFDYNSDGGWK